MDKCVFCEKFENNDSVVMIFAPLNPVVEGHMLVVPRKHVADFSEDPSTTALVMADAAAWVKDAVGDYNLITSKGKAATQSVFHLHVHLVPRNAGDGLMLPWTNQETPARQAS
jgi:histidine triad (HIT) family protein